MEHIQLSLFGKTSWELFHQMTGWILRPCLNRSQIPKFQCLLLKSGQTPEWSEGMMLISLGDCWMPNIGEGPHLLKEEDVSFSWQILEKHVPQKYYLKPAICNRFLRLSERTGCPPPLPVEYLLKKQGGKYPSSVPFKNDVCEVQPKKKMKKDFTAVSEEQEILSQLYSQDP